MRKGYMLAEALIAVVIAGIIAVVFTSINYYTYIQANMLKQQNTKTILEVVRSRLVSLAEDPDTDQYFELLKEDSNSTLPLSVGVGTDAWGQRIYYYTIDLGSTNSVNATFADTNTSISPNDNIAGRLVSSGEDMNLETNASDSEAQGDDLMLEIGIGELNHFKLYGGSEITSQTRGYNSAVVSATAPTSPLDGTLWYDTNNTVLKVYSLTDANWTTL